MAQWESTGLEIVGSLVQASPETLFNVNTLYQLHSTGLTQETSQHD